MIKLGKLKLYTDKEVFGDLLKKKKNRDIYNTERARLNLIRQIKELRRKKRLTQRGFAKKVGMPQSVIARLETGRHSVSFNTLAQIAGTFHKQIILT